MTEVTNSPATLNDQVEALYAEVQKRKAEIQAVSREQYVTNCLFRSNGQGEMVDIRTIRYISKIQEHVAFLMGRKRDFDEAGKVLGLSSPAEFQWYNVTYEQWINDFKIAATRIELVERKEKLARLEEKLLKISSPEFLKALQLKEIEAEMVE